MVQIFKRLTVGTDLYNYELTWVSEYNEVPVFIYPCFNLYPYPFLLLLLVSVATHPMSMPVPGVDYRGGISIYIPPYVTFNAHDWSKSVG